MKINSLSADQIPYFLAMIEYNLQRNLQKYYRYSSIKTCTMFF